ncbi:MAG: hypothetical protein E6K91_07175 [Thaumarchaeota archaeon]|nr:MAG: hypothetical protein E6K91_07175 [Nitrososphaerota archaeon]
MQEFCLDYLRCINCKATLELQIFERTDEVDEGLFHCLQCKRRYPIISSIPFLIKDLPSYFSIRTELGGHLMLESKNEQLRSFIKESLQKIERCKKILQS